MPRGGEPGEAAANHRDFTHVFQRPHPEMTSIDSAVSHELGRTTDNKSMPWRGA
jgi:hypothetical protein